MYVQYGDEIVINYFRGTVFNAPVQAYVNTINTVGFMGAGLALEFALRYPDLLKDYETKCNQKLINLGKIDYFDAGNGITLINFSTKGHFKYPSRLSWIESGLKNFTETYKNYNITSVAFPRLGCAHGGLNWIDVQKLMTKYLGTLNIDIYICLDQLSYAEGKEKDMVDNFNKMYLNIIADEVKLTKKQRELLTNAKPVSRFWHISKISGIGEKTYANLFNYFYNFVDNSTQLSLFDI